MKQRRLSEDPNISSVARELLFALMLLEEIEDGSPYTPPKQKGYVPTLALCTVGSALQHTQEALHLLQDSYRAILIEDKKRKKPGRVLAFSLPSNPNTSTTPEASARRPRKQTVGK